eukprot:GHVT01090512.1.p1 GENE.GHVT01090512.1~~GHVT01090512.1.p1  ORF type:complete len:132 (+),score=7.47 GHVT01090512.1:521-916(+)
MISARAARTLSVLNRMQTARAAPCGMCASPRIARGVSSCLPIISRFVHGPGRLSTPPPFSSRWVGRPPTLRDTQSIRTFSTVLEDYHTNIHEVPDMPANVLAAATQTAVRTRRFKPVGNTPLLADTQGEKS